MTKVNLLNFEPIEVKADPDFDGIVNLLVGGEYVELDSVEARELVKALKKHIKKAEGK